MNMQNFADALASKGLHKYSPWFSDNMRLYVPVYEEPMLGKQAAATFCRSSSHCSTTSTTSTSLKGTQRMRSSFARK